ncbi:MAG: hydantoinase/oxoprolinase family protein [Alphaproteobacteria bacterium]|nr:hydantoinase/oxoprolinase family protein [Alphaproteobacteria bacterium]
MRVGFDIGGTFTDIVVADDDGRLHTAKVLSLLDQVGADIAAAVEHAAKEAPVAAFVHGTTIASNAVIEGKAAPTGLLTTRGFRDELEMRGQRRPNVFDANWNRLPPLVPRRWRREIEERILGDGSIEHPLDARQVQAEVRRLVADGVEAIAVSLINAYLNPRHEAEIGRLIDQLAPELVVCLSSEVHPEIREYERASTTVINASLIPIVRRYLDNLEGHLARFGQRLLIMQSNGGIMTAAAARRRPALMIESGPAAGVLAAARFAQHAELARVISFDMGGTTAKACLIENGVPLEKPGGEVGGGATMTTRLFGGAGHALRVPWLDIVEVGAGGGSIAWIDEGGALRAGPRSAGADPGPVCYGRGGSEPTVTDANVVLGYMNPSAIADATLRIDRQAAFAAIEAKVARPLGLDPLQAAHGIVQVANATMMRALRAVSTERGRDPRQYALIPFGGAGPMHAATLAENLGIRVVHVPPHPGLFSALGLLLADYRHDYIRSIALALSELQDDAVAAGFAALQTEALADLAAEGIAAQAVRFQRQVDLKYGYQVTELTLPFEPESQDSVVGYLKNSFNAAHRQAFGYQRDDVIELVSLRLRAQAAADKLDLAGIAGAGKGRPRRLGESSRQAYFGPRFGLHETPVVGRWDLQRSRSGPLVVEEPDTTVVVPPNWTALSDAAGHLTLHLAGS